MTEVVSYKGEKYQVEDKRTVASFRCENNDENGNPSVNFVVTKYLTPKELASEESRLKAKNSKVTMTFAHEISTLFREVVNQDNKNKDVKVVQVQRKFKNGSWNKVNPFDEMKATGDKVSTKWTKSMKVLAWSLVVAIIAAVGYVLWG